MKILSQKEIQEITNIKFPHSTSKDWIFTTPFLINKKYMNGLWLVGYRIVTKNKVALYYYHPHPYARQDEYGTVKQIPIKEIIKYKDLNDKIYEYLVTLKVIKEVSDVKEGK